VSIRALEVAIPGIINSIIVCTLFIFIFGIIGINYFKGKLYNCEVGDLDVSQIINDKWDCLNVGAQWKNSFLNFDNTGNSMVSIFIVSSTFEWSNIMYNVLSIRGPDLVYNDSHNSIENPYAALFFILIVIVGNFFLMNLFIGVIITQYNREKELVGKDFMLTEEQKKWVKDRIMILQTQPKYKMKIPISEFR
jgi:hypothetical protein